MSSLRARGVRLEGAAALGRIVREEPAIVAKHYADDIVAGVDVLLALTSDTMPRALAHIGMAFRAAALTRTAVELALESAERSSSPVAVAGVLGNRWVEPMLPERIAEECAMHAARLAASGCQIIIARGFTRAGASPTHLARLARVTAIVSASTTHLPTWALAELDGPERTTDGESLGDYVSASVDSGAQVLLLEVSAPEVGLRAIERASAGAGSAKIGVLLAANEAASVEDWARGAKALADAGARVVGGGMGTTAGHVAALAHALHGKDP